jgi:inositol phosphorylceramide synthase catalytic subunit
MGKMEFDRFGKKNVIVAVALATCFMLWDLLVGEVRFDHFMLIAFCLLAFFYNEKSRRFIIAFSIFIIYWIVYDAMRLLPNYEVSAVNIREPYEIEKSLFGIFYQGAWLTPNEYFAMHHHKILDFLAGLFYINWVPIPIAFAVYLFFKDKYLFAKYSMVFLLVNLFGFAIYYIYPAAPPWYVDLYGFDLQIGVPGNRAGLARFDELIGFPIFQNIYNQNANVLAAMPSLHATYPLIVLYYGIKKRLGWINVLFVVFMLGIWFSAVYSFHHYFIDVIVGILLTIVVIFLFERFSIINPLKKWINSFVRKISPYQQV